MPKAMPIVIKCGTRVLVNDSQEVRNERIQSLMAEINELKLKGYQPLLVTSGAVALGLRGYNKTRSSASSAERRAAAALGQIELIQALGDAARDQNLALAQLLLTREDFENRERFLILKETFLTLFSQGSIPVLNENDVTALDDSGFRDNDHVAALATLLLRDKFFDEPPILFFLSGTDGLFQYSDGKPSERIGTVNEITKETFSLVEREADQHSLGGMRSKLLSIQLAYQSGSHSWILAGEKEKEIKRALAGEKTGTHFLPSANPLGEQLSSRKAWIALFHHSNGSVTVDAGASKALTEGSRSLLPVGVSDVEGEFTEGDVIRIIRPDGSIIGNGIIKVSSNEMLRIKGKKTEQARELLERSDLEEVINRDDMVVFPS